MSRCQYPYRSFADLYQLEFAPPQQQQQRQQQAQRQPQHQAGLRRDSASSSSSSCRDSGLVRWGTSSTASSSSTSASAPSPSILLSPSPPAAPQDAHNAEERKESTWRCRKFLSGGGRRASSSSRTSTSTANSGSGSVHFVDQKQPRALRSRAVADNQNGDAADVVRSEMGLLAFADEGLSLCRVAARGR
ncbi:unnamed protein product [Tilletia controversa]|uniref:Uncharacterized protein n=3 Tax=Tilletia TaxID=13289 RepID=A0A8X7SXI8_9BASI|nr:hypothetical protein CF335_g5065 [Tilletia laevis]KAE8198910.1 hypothetical protein CF328_g3401 [Tilletia controversa]KAE8256925.1 hypothetical protein A4X03_0g4924 [Tilletia caries]KAE8199385.1 hypothetical protein CF336_g1220 [Tilletia laevis]KAE8247863.1 hypothetical protein A4X06_0g4133 [Tilletia controversa]